MQSFDYITVIRLFKYNILWIYMITIVSAQFTSTMSMDVKISLLIIIGDCITFATVLLYVNIISLYKTAALFTRTRTNHNSILLLSIKLANHLFKVFISHDDYWIYNGQEGISSSPYDTCNNIGRRWHNI